MHQRRRRLFSRLAFAATCGVLLATPAFPETLTPEQAVAYALAHHPDLAAGEARASAAQARVAAAKSANLPQIDARYRARVGNNPLDALADKLNTRSVTAADFNPDTLNDPDTTRLHMSGLALQWPIYSAGRIGAGVRAATGGATAAQLSYERQQQQIAAGARRAYVAAQVAQAGLAITDDAVASAQQHANTTAALFRQGRLVQSDKLSAAVNVSAIKGQRAQAEARAHNALTQLKLALGMPLETEVGVTPLADLNTAEAKAANKLAELERRALAARKDLRALVARTDSSRAEVDAARAATGMQVNLLATTGWYDRDPAFANNSWSVMGEVSKNLYAGGKARHQTAAAQYAVSAATAQHDAAMRAVRAEVRQAYEGIEEARTRLSLARENVATARDTVRLVKRRYGEGRTILLDLLQAERVLVETRSEELAARQRLLESEIALQASLGEQ